MLGLGSLTTQSVPHAISMKMFHHGERILAKIQLDIISGNTERVVPRPPQGGTVLQ